MVSPGGGELTNFADGEDDDSTEETSALTPGGDLTTADLPSAGGGETQARRIAFLFDSTLTAFLMMGNLSTVRHCCKSTGDRSVSELEKPCSHIVRSWQVKRRSARQLH